MPDSKKQPTPHAIEKSLALLRAGALPEGTDKDSVEHWLEIAVEGLRRD